MSENIVTTPTFNPLGLKDDIDAFRAEVRAWLEATLPNDWQDRMRGATEDEFVDQQRWWLREMSKVGLATPHWPKEWGGEDLSLRHQIVVWEEMARIDSPEMVLFVISLYHMPATLFSHGSEEQRKHLKLFQDDSVVWCQGFSEPGAGSDLASLRTKAERKGDVYVVNGQKIWSSLGMFADYCLLLARTKPDAPKKQAGISYFIMDMRSPGVTVRPIKQITGGAEFTEIFMDNVEIPVGNLIGEENEGWAIAQSTLSAERGLIVFNLSERLAYAFERDLEKGRDTWARDPQFRREFGLLHARLRAVRVLIRRNLEALEKNPHSGGTINLYIKLYWAQLLQDYTLFLIRAEGIDALTDEPPIQGGGHSSGQRVVDFYNSFAWTISGGTNEVMRNMIAERVLGLPR